MNASDEEEDNEFNHLIPPRRKEKPSSPGFPEQHPEIALSTSYYLSQALLIALVEKGYIKKSVVEDIMSELIKQSKGHGGASL